MLRACILLVAAVLAYLPLPAFGRQKLLVVSVDGLDWRYLRDRDSLGLHIPNVRHLLEHGDSADGVVGVYPTITWPSHTSLITGKRPDQHGIRGNQRPKSEGGGYYWTVDFLKARTLWQVAHEAGLTTASITWPVTVGATIDVNLPEYFLRRNGGSMDLEGVQSKATPGLVDEIGKASPSFPQQWMDDRTRALAAEFLLKTRQPDLILLHFVDLDSEAHDQGPFGINANAVMERTDELIGDLLRALPSAYDLALVSDHGFERVDKEANLPVMLAQKSITGDLHSFGGLATTTDPAVADFLRTAAKDSANGIGREVPHTELLRFAPELGNVVAAFEPADHIMFGPNTKGAYFTPPHEKGNHGFWPLRHDYRSVFVLSGPGVAPTREGEIDMLSIAARLANVLQVPAP